MYLTVTITPIIRGGGGAGPYYHTLPYCKNAQGRNFDFRPIFIRTILANFYPDGGSVLIQNEQFLLSV